MGLSIAFTLQARKYCSPMQAIDIKVEGAAVSTPNPAYAMPLAMGIPDALSSTSQRVWADDDRARQRSGSSIVNCCHPARIF
jgi:hypothetical protein